MGSGIIRMRTAGGTWQRPCPADARSKLMMMTTIKRVQLSFPVPFTPVFKKQTQLMCPKTQLKCPKRTRIRKGLCAFKNIP